MCVWKGSQRNQKTKKKYDNLDLDRELNRIEFKLRARECLVCERDREIERDRDREREQTRQFTEIEVQKWQAQENKKFGSIGCCSCCTDPFLYMDCFGIRYDS